MLKGKTLFLIIVIMSLLMVVGCNGTSDGKENETEQEEESSNQGTSESTEKEEVEGPRFTNATVHDPSVIRVDDTFYVFGSHLAAAKSTDLMNWQQIATSVSETNPLIENVFEELAETFEWAQTDTLWAPDVTQLEDGRFYMYYNACEGTAPRSALGVAVADNIEGPYEDLGIFLKSGMWGEPSEDGPIYDPRIHPNVVDPHTFFDEDGELWMVYGSYSGGIYILQMDRETGFPLPNQGYGKRLMGGNHSRIEGAYILYSPETNYYYMYLSFGGLDANGAYNMRVVRSENPDGPYYDAEGNAMIDVKSDPDLPLFDDESIEPYGVKLMGNFEFIKDGGDGPSRRTGYVSPGHNSAYFDEETGKNYLIFHTRFPRRGELHEIRVHQMFMNSEGWPVVTPHRYAGEVIEAVSKSEIVGDYQFINHGKDISAEIKNSVPIQLNDNNTITGEVTGQWALVGDYEVELSIDGVIYNGVFLTQWDESTRSYVMTFSALSNEGVAVWGSME
ncbi:beta-xylosidase [Evansella vedderi]|uniref:Beta-xylosidase n=2 Tax=Evansella vedderi TaxID=38282 RepID=A0ABU0A3K3_9BACI|nr:beta-xylosidase [Evansella vedderi]